MQEFFELKQLQTRNSGVTSCKDNQSNFLEMLELHGKIHDAAIRHDVQQLRLLFHYYKQS